MSTYACATLGIMPLEGVLMQTDSAMIRDSLKCFVDDKVREYILFCFLCRLLAVTRKILIFCLKTVENNYTDN